ncbi:MAG: helix-hairpin-helix domain-containing protein [Actinomycetota bacterium]
MPESIELPERPRPPQRAVQRLVEWLRWVGWARVGVTSVAVLAVLAAAYWLVAPPQPTTESKLPFAAASPTTEAAPSATEATEPDAKVVVHVAGAVERSGVYHLVPGSRVVDAIETAGGAAANAEVDAINLAAPLVDGQRVYVPRVGEAVPQAVADGQPAGPLDLNAATEEQLDDLPGVGPATAAAIVAHREANGPFGSVDDLGEVRGIGPAKLDALRELVTV